MVEQQQVDVAQAAAPCRYEASPSTLNLDGAEHQVGIALTALNGCAWTADSDVPWVTGAEPADGAGSATVRVWVAANPTDAPTGTVVISNATVRVNQSGAGRADLLRLVMRRGVVLTVSGVVVGAGAALQSTRLLGYLLCGVSPRDPLAFGLAFAVIGLASLIACALPAWRAVPRAPIL